MRVVNVKRNLILLTVIFGSIAVVTASYLAADSHAIKLRREKAEEFRRLDAILRGRNIDRVLTELGQPTRLSFEPEIPATRPGGPTLPARLRLTYDYRSWPWSMSADISVHVNIEMPRGIVTSMAVHETYRR